MSDSEKVDAFIKNHTQWKEKLQQLRGIIRETELKEEVKWGKPTYTFNGKSVVGMASFKNHIALWFPQGVFLKDEHNKLINAQEGITKAQRQWRFTTNDKIEHNLVLKYLEEAISNSKTGKELKPERNKAIIVPPLLKQEFQKDFSLKNNFQDLSLGKQREYAEYIAQAKRATTQQNRLQKCIPLIKRGMGLHDKHKNT
ncbi:YdeI/OmpD-associated family protein [Aequorivita capsosiphonis]|uniref:YdeI/OmpD-associated family protein n=1 Tax=Aequorivita capsosiphonis TaxID=487317 RepID=UPI000478AD2C|nr:DUF1801 domain-containing protein [Aequorivita capsosiphonis]